MSVPSVSTRVLAGVVVASAAVTAGLLVSPTATVATLESVTASPTLFGGAIGALYLVRPLFAWPTTPLAAVVGYGFGVTMGVPIALAGVIVTVTPIFLVARATTGRGSSRPSTTGPDGNTAVSTSVSERREPTEAGWIGSALGRTTAVIDRYFDTAGPIRGVIASRLAPIPSDISTCAAAVSGVRYRHLVIGTAIGELPWTIAAVVVGASAGTVTAGGFGELGLVLTLACCLAALVLLAGPAYRVFRTRTDEQSAIDG
ncbi:uncharacterized protein Nmag_0056 [Natrialba magadii ATCC 43099]|uniref:VTT domain-containing protein n=1 Tax=Natrialba magadii (strain ATCC 43099 / DSM 3394 / CCM 3739 / CIP 104546 / IAM 13178 / JCM 8861 / NBRC 102185 / NCIMB 2190 / MS3) TaxID=547559 RepID=D3SVT6_NATMM|nr:VTT domain-containing protein [Natrialba magadii]ADD03655.1 uncharacterized protein Nmag_0056 [Natrialba magadii ATCC 43099]ELY34421.1 hypothetical protein C500_00762 [Natrialba magadii ATCC 43099]